MKNKIKIAAGILISAVSLWFVFRGFELNDLKTALSEAKFIWFLPALALFMVSFVFRTLRWALLISPIKWVPFTRLFPVLVMGFFMNVVLPARGGEFLRMISLSQKEGLPFGSCLGTVVAERTMDIIGMLMVIAVASRLLPMEQIPVKPLLIAFGLAAGGILFAFLIRSRWKPANTNGIAGKFFLLIDKIISGFSAVKSPKLIAGAVFLTACIWLNEIIIAMIVSRAMNIDLSFYQSAALIVGLCVGVMIPAAPGFIGTFEFFGKQMLVFLGFPGNEALSFVLSLHFFQILAMSLIGIPSLFHVGLKKTETSVPLAIPS